MAQAAMDMNFYISFSGIVTFKSATELQDVARRMPLERMLVETDSPYLVPEPYRGRVKRCEPAFVKEIADVAARVKGCSLDELSQATCQAAEEFFPKLGTG